MFWLTGYLACCYVACIICFYQAPRAARLRGESGTKQDLRDSHFKVVQVFTPGEWGEKVVGGGEVRRWEGRIEGERTSKGGKERELETR